MIDLKRLRKENNLSQKDLSNLLNVNQSFISQIETFKKQLPYQYIEILKNKYNLEKYIISDILPIDNEIYYEKSGVKSSIQELAIFIAKNEDEFMKEKVFENIIEIRVAKRLVDLTSNKEEFLKFISEK